MSIAGDLARNRQAYLLLANVREEEEKKEKEGKEEREYVRESMKPLPREAVRYEEGGMDELQFRQRVRELEALEPSPQRAVPEPEPVRYSLDCPPVTEQMSPVGGTTAGSEQPMEVEISSVDSPAVNGEAGPKGEDLLDTLLQRLERNARRYPQPLGEEE